MSGAPQFLDANVFMYAAGSPHPHKDPCVAILADVEQGVLTATTNTEVLQEILYRYSRIGLPDKGIELCRKILAFPMTILAVTPVDIAEAAAILETHHATGLQPRDAVHAATMHNNGISHLLSADQHFDALSSLTRIDPSAYRPP